MLILIYAYLVLMQKLKLRRLPKIPTLVALLTLQTVAPPLSERIWSDIFRISGHPTAEGLTQNTAILYIDQHYGAWDWTRQLARHSAILDLAIVPAMTGSLESALLEAELQRYSNDRFKREGNTPEYRLELLMIADRINLYINRKCFEAKAISGLYIDEYRHDVVSTLSELDEEKSPAQYYELSERKTIETSSLAKTEAIRMQAVAVAEEHLLSPDQNADGLISFINVDDSGAMTSTVVALLNLKSIRTFATSNTKLGRALMKHLTPGKSTYLNLDSVREIMGPGYEYRIGEVVLGMDCLSFLNAVMDRLPELSAMATSETVIPIGEVTKQRVITVFSLDEVVYLPEWLADNILEFVTLPEILIIRIPGSIVPSHPTLLVTPTTLELVEGDKVVSYELQSIAGTNMETKACFANVLKNGEWRHVTDISRDVIDTSKIFEYAEVYFFHRS